MRKFLLITSLFFVLSAQALLSQALKEATFLCGPIPALCTPGSVNTGGLGVGITSISINQLNNISMNNGGGAGYQDFTCSDSTWLNQGDTYVLQVITGQTYAEVVRLWIDFGNDGGFDSTELIFDGPPTVYLHYANIPIPIAGMTGIPLRMRLGSEVEMYPPPDGCLDVQNGQYEDFTVYLNGPTDIRHTELQIRTILFPNPFYSFGVLSINSQMPLNDLQIRIYNALGVLVRSEAFKATKFQNELIIERENLTEGIYIYELLSANSGLRGTGKFLIQ